MSSNDAGPPPRSGTRSIVTVSPAVATAQVPGGGRLLPQPTATRRTTARRTLASAGTHDPQDRRGARALRQREEHAMGRRIGGDRMRVAARLVVTDERGAGLGDVPDREVAALGRDV